MNKDSCPWVIRTDFSDEAGWEKVCALIAEPQTEHKFLAYVRFVSDDDFVLGNIIPMLVRY